MRKEDVAKNQVYSKSEQSHAYEVEINHLTIKSN
jgi:hypothetical protein